ncbi:MAG: glutathione S-transferase C-terminal domain-containing protein, partial [Asticcacaulis sp.]|nr:glutathione S-transferase C-terminal domain-containing protein [Asticcacaulis sp.]
LMLGTRMKFPALAVLETPNPVVADYMLASAGDYCVRLDAHLAGREFVCADRLTVADIVAACAFDFARIVRFRPDKGLEHLWRWTHAMRERASKLGV